MEISDLVIGHDMETWARLLVHRDDLTVALRAAGARHGVQMVASLPRHDGGLDTSAVDRLPVRMRTMMTVDVVGEMAAEVIRREPINGIRIVGIDGRSGSGKSVLAARLSTRLNAPVIEIDDFVSWDCFADRLVRIIAG